MPRSCIALIGLLCAVFPARGQQTASPAEIRIIGVARDPAGSPVRGAVVATLDQLGLPAKVTFTGADGRFELTHVAAETEALEVLHPAYAPADLHVSWHPRALRDSGTVVMLVNLRGRTTDTTPISAAPPVEVLTRSPANAALEVLARTAGLPPLQDVRGSNLDREVRVYFDYSDTFKGAVVLRRRRGHVAGEVWLWWIVGPESGAGFGLDATAGSRQRAVTFGCGDVPWRLATVLRDTVRVWRWVLACRAPFWMTPDWGGLLSRLDSLDVWSLPDQTAQLSDRAPSTRYRSVVTVDMFDGRRRRLARHADPDSLNVPPGGRAYSIQTALDPAIAALMYRPTSMLGPVHAIRIRGVVRDTTGEPVAGALITAPAVPTSARTDANGRFDLQHPVPWGSSKLVVEKRGFQTESYPITSLSAWTLDSSAYRTEIVLHPIAIPQAVVRPTRDTPQLGQNLAVDVRIASLTMSGDTVRVSFIVATGPTSQEPLFRFIVDAPAPVVGINRPAPRESWYTSTTQKGMSVASWSILGSIIPPGSSTPTLTYEAIGLPTVVTYWATGHFDPPPYRPIPEDAERPPPREAIAANAVAGTTVGVEPFPPSLRADSLLLRLDGLLTRGCTDPAWIRSANVCERLRGDITAARRASSKQDSATARAKLAAFRATLDAQHGPGRPINDSAYWLLRVNAEFILGRL